MSFAKEKKKKMNTTYAYGKFRREFGRECRFSRRKPIVLEDLTPDIEQRDQWITRNTLNQHVGINVDWSACEVNTMRLESIKCGVSHTEGGWPKDTNPDDLEQVARYRRKEIKSESYLHEIPKLANAAKYWINQNNSIDIFQRYFTDPECKKLQTSVASSITVAVLNDLYRPMRPVQHVSWSAEKDNLIAISYADLRFQMADPKCSSDSFVFDLEYCVDPYFKAQSPYPIVKLEFHHKNEHCLAGGLTSGQVAVWDIRRRSTAVTISNMQNSHRHPVKSLQWIHSKSNAEFYTGSSDGQVMWWDVRKLTKPTEVLILDLPTPIFNDEPNWTIWARPHGVSSMDYHPSIPVRFMIGTEGGLVYNGNRKGKTVSEKISATYHCHHGSVFAVKRNPTFFKCFLTVGDSQVRVWTEDVKKSFIMCTKHYNVSLTDGAWSETVPSIFFTARADGFLDVWDVLQDQTGPVFTQKVSDVDLSCIRCHKNGVLVAIGDSSGKAHVLKMNNSLASVGKNERVQMTALLEQEIKREKLLETKQREIKVKNKLPTTVPSTINDNDSKEDKSVSQKMEKKYKRFEQMFNIIDEESKEIKAQYGLLTRDVSGHVISRLSPEN